MTAVDRVRRARALLTFAVLTSATAWGAAATFLTLAASGFAESSSAGSSLSAGAQLAAASLAGISVSLALLWRSRHVASLYRVALWIEELIPGLEYSLITAIEPRYSDFARRIDPTLSEARIISATAKALRRRMALALAAAGAATALLYVSPSRALGEAGLPGGLGAARAGDGRSSVNRLQRLRVEVTPPAYAGLREQALDDPSSIAALVGSGLRITGPGGNSGVTVSLGGSPVPVSNAGSRWSASFAMPRKPVALTLRHGGSERILVLEPQPDNPPKISLLSPTRDSTLRVARLVLALDARASDDIGLSGGYFEYLITTGSGEIFNARTLTTPLVRFAGARTGTLRSTLDLARLGLNQGDVVSIRAIVQDANTVSGPGIATSDTRTFRIARASEYDSLSIEAAAPTAVDTSAMSQRMLVIMTEQLVKEQPRLARPELVKRSTQIGDMEDRIRKRVDMALHAPDSPEDQVHMEEEGHTHGPTSPREGVSDDMVVAYDALWKAVRSLQIAEPDSALPHMRVALEALDRVRLANRLYLRGLPPPVIVDLARVRMTGKEKGVGSVRTPLSAADSIRVRLETAFERALEQIERSPATALRSFTLLRVEALSAEPAFAAALGEAIEAIRGGRDATVSLLRARRTLLGNPVGTPGLPEWSGAQ